MNNLFNRLVYICAVLLMVSPLVSCGGGGGSPAGTGTLNLGLTDAAGDYKAVYVTINEVWVKQAGKDWEMLIFNDPEMVLPQTLNLLDYVNGFRARLGYAELEAGHYTQMRLILEDSIGAPQSQDLNILSNPHPFYNYVIDSADNEIFLKVPSGGNSGIKIVNGFDIENAKSTDIILDFDAHKSVHAHPAGKTGEWRLRPTIKVVEIINSVSGMVVTAPEVVAQEEEVPVVVAQEEEVPVVNVPVGDAWVSAQIYDDTPGIDFKDEVVVVAGSFSEVVDGTYFMLLPKNITVSPYNIVVTKDDFEPQCQGLDSTASAEYIDVNFTLAPADKIGNVSGSIVGLPEPAGGDDYSVYLSIRKLVDCDGNDEPETWVEVESLPPFVNDDGSDIDYGPIILPGAGDYEIIAWADGAGTLPPFDINIAADGDAIQYIDLGNQIDFSLPSTP